MSSEITETDPDTDDTYRIVPSMSIHCPGAGAMAVSTPLGLVAVAHMEHGLGSAAISLFELPTWSMGPHSDRRPRFLGIVAPRQGFQLTASAGDCCLVFTEPTEGHEPCLIIGSPTMINNDHRWFLQLVNTKTLSSAGAIVGGMAPFCMSAQSEADHPVGLAVSGHLLGVAMSGTTGSAPFGFSTRTPCDVIVFTGAGNKWTPFVRVSLEGLAWSIPYDAIGIARCAVSMWRNSGVDWQPPKEARFSCTRRLDYFCRPEEDDGGGGPPPPFLPRNPFGDGNGRRKAPPLATQAPLPHLGVLVINNRPEDGHVHVLANADTRAMLSMTPIRVAWITAVVTATALRRAAMEKATTSPRTAKRAKGDVAL